MNLGSSERPLRVAIIGAGPSGFYAAEALFKSGYIVHVDMYEKLPVPYGLVRFGVAPDHQKIKNVTKIYEKIASHPHFHFLGNVTVGRDIQVEELKQYYDALIFTSGAAADRRLNVPGEDLRGSHTATEFVAWYNGHPEFRDRVFDLSHKTAVIIGQGNVAVDVCRILAKSVEELKQTDIADYALEALAESKIQDIYMIGRRGPAQAAFTPQEAKELGELEACDVLVNPRDLELGPVCEAELSMADRGQHRKNIEILRDFAARKPSGKPRRLHIVFFYSPVALQGQERLQQVVLERNTLSGEPGQQKAVGTGEQWVLDCGLLFRSVGYKGTAIPGLPFDERAGIFPNQKGRIAPGLYTAGWIKRGPSGIIGTNKPCSYETVESLLADLEQLPPCSIPHSEAVHELLKQRQISVVSFADWKKIDAAEIAQGQASGKPRKKLTHVAEMLAVLSQG